MLPTLVRQSKASRRALTPKRGNKDYYKGTRAAYLPGGHRTGAPGRHVIRGKANYRIIDEQVRVYIAPPVESMETSQLRPYVHRDVHVSPKEKRIPYGKLGQEGLTPEALLELMRRGEPVTS